MRRLSLIVPVMLVAVLVCTPARARAQAPGDSLPYVTSITTIPAQPCDSIPTRIVVAGEFPTQCGAVLGHFGFTIYVSDPNPPCAGCLAGPKPWADTLGVGALPAGQYAVSIRMGVVKICTPGDTARSETRYTFNVVHGCPPPNAFDPMTYVEHVRITPQRDPTTPLICEGDSILLRVSGTFPDDCHILRSIELVPNVGIPGGVVPVPPSVRLVFDTQCCQQQICTPFPTQWEAQLVLPPLPPGLRGLDLVGYEVCCRDIPNSTDPVGRRHYDFSVTSAESCGVVPPPITCLYPSWLHDQDSRCDAFLTKTGGPAVVTGTVLNTVALAGIQGEVHSYQNGEGWPLFVTAIEPTGPATGMHLTWEPVANGAKFVLWADQGAPIPPEFGHRPSQFLKISWALAARNTRDPGIVPPDTRWFISWNQVFGSDIDGTLVPLCPIQTGVVADVAFICYGEPAACDFNGDNHSDVRDLVLMSHCLVSPRACPWDSNGLDCDGDNDFDFDDLFCCARHVIGFPPCDSCQDSVRVETGIAMSFGTPQRTADGIDIPVRIDGAVRIGAGRFQISVPGALASNASFESSSSIWLPVTRNTGDGLEVGLIQLPPNPGDRYPDWLEAVVHLPLPAGTQASGEVRLTEAQLSGPDGVMLAADLGSPVVRLGPGLGVSLSQARPNPFAGSTTFRLTLDAAAGSADIGVYDLSGRRVAMLHQGALPIGSHPFTWDGRIDGGGRAKSGVYFVRALVDGRTTRQKLVMLKQ